MDARKYLKKAAFELIGEKAIDKISVKELVERADVSKQSFYRYYDDKYSLANEVYAELTQGMISPETIHNIEDWKDMYKHQFSIFREHYDFIRHLYSSKEVGCTLDFEIKSTIRFDKELLKMRGADISNPRILFAIQAKDVGGTYMMRDWILSGMLVSDEEMVERFQLIVPMILVPYILKQ